MWLTLICFHNISCGNVSFSTSFYLFMVSVNSDLCGGRWEGPVKDWVYHLNELYATLSSHIQASFICEICSVMRNNLTHSPALRPSGRKRASVFSKTHSRSFWRVSSYSPTGGLLVPRADSQKRGLGRYKREPEHSGLPVPRFWHQGTCEILQMQLLCFSFYNLLEFPPNTVLF